MGFWDWILSWVKLLVLGGLGLFLLIVGLFLYMKGQADNVLVGQIIGDILAVGGFLILLFAGYKRIKGWGYVERGRGF